MSDSEGVVRIEVDFPVASGSRIVMLWFGIKKLMEEMGELSQVLGKLQVCPIGEHWDERQSGDLYRRLEEELGDVLAAVQYFAAHNTISISPERVLVRSRLKLRRFEEWQLDGLLCVVPPTAVRCQMDFGLCECELPCPHHGWHGATRMERESLDAGAAERLEPPKDPRDVFPEPSVKWRGSVGDLLTDLAGLLTREQLKELGLRCSIEHEG